MDAPREPAETEPRIEPRIEGQIESLVERYLDELGAGREPDLEAMARELSDEAARSRFRAKALAQAYLVRAAEAAETGGPVVLDAYLARLTSEAEREVFWGELRDAELARAHVPGELVPGMRLDGRYEIRRELGRGGMGVVYVAFDRELEREVAVKVLRLQPGTEASDWTELFRREARTLARLNSRNIVTIHDAHRGRRSYIVMDLVRGRDLLWILEEARQQRAELGPRSAASSEPLRRAIGRRTGGDHAEQLGERTHARTVARIGRLMALTLEHAHGAGVIHRDLKPQNVMLVPGGEPVLLDFGLASWGQEGSEEGFRGTPEYMAPEQIESMRAGSDPRTDVYQLGLVLYEMLSLRRAYPRKSREELWPLFERIQKGQRDPLPSGVPRGLAAIVEKAMERDPARRYQTMRARRSRRSSGRSGSRRCCGCGREPGCRPTWSSSRSRRGVASSRSHRASPS
jgi:serine/threonine-protein kinase